MIQYSKNNSGSQPVVNYSSVYFDNIVTCFLSDNEITITMPAKIAKEDMITDII